MGSANSQAGRPVEGLLAAAHNGSNSAMGHLLEACRGYMLLLANRALDDELRQKTAASDLVQETFLHAQRDFSAFQGTTEKELFAWLTQILINRLRYNTRQFRGTQKRDIHREIALDGELDRIATELFEKDDTPSALVAALEEEKLVQQCLARLSEIDQQVLILRSWERRTFVEIGQTLGRSTEAARKLWSRAVERLGRELDNGR